MTKPAKPKPKPGRTRPAYVVVMMTDDEKQTVQEAVSLAGVPMSVWMRALALKEARRQAKQK